VCSLTQHLSTCPLLSETEETIEYLCGCGIPTSELSSNHWGGKVWQQLKKGKASLNRCQLSQPHTSLLFTADPA
jgi:hypothetical protein